MKERGLGKDQEKDGCQMVPTQQVGCPLLPCWPLSPPPLLPPSLYSQDPQTGTRKALTHVGNPARCTDGQ